MTQNLHVACPHCHTTNRVAGERLGDGATCGKCRMMTRFGIRSIPTLVVFRDGKEVARTSGALGAPQLTQWIESHVAA